MITNKIKRRLLRIIAPPTSTTAREQFKNLSLYYPPLHNPIFWRKVAGFHKILQAIQANDLAGDVVECGVGTGLLIIAQFINQLEMDCRLYGFDSFEGFPLPSQFDKSPRKPIKGDLWADTSVEHVKGHFVSAGLKDYLEKNVFLIPGFFDKTVPYQEEPKQITLLSVDADLYDSYRVCMEYFGPRVTGLILYDEYNSPKWPGATQAVDEYLPLLKHNLFYSKLMDRYFSLPQDETNNRFATTLIESLQAELLR